MSIKFFPFAKYKPTILDKMRLNLAQKEEWLEVHTEICINLRSEITDLRAKYHIQKQKE